MKGVDNNYRDFPSSSLFGTKCWPLVPQFRNNDKLTYFLKSIVARLQIEKGRIIPKLTPIEGSNI